MREKYFNSLQILRTFAFLGVFLIHVTLAPPVVACWSITVFLMLSGFLNALHGYNKTITYDLKNSVKYANNKIKNLYPLHVVMLGIAFVLYVFSYRNEILLDMKRQAIILPLKFLSNLFLISDWGPKSGWLYNIFSEYNIVTWYLSLSLLLFLLSPFCIHIMHKLYDKSGGKAVVKALRVSALLYFLTIIINVFFVFLFGKEGAFLYTYECPLSRVGEYLIAMQLGYIYQQTKKNEEVYSKWIALLGLSVLVSIILILVSALGLLGSENWLSSTGFYFTIPVSIIILSLVKLDSIIKENVIIDFFVAFGSLTQYAYLIHVPVINFIHGVYRRVTDVNVYVWGLFSFIITMMISGLVKKYKDLARKKNAI